jgi:PhzF family phenazine biosynthesis protein
MPLPLFQVDAFAGRPFAGNPAAVCLLDAPAGEAWMQSVAAEMNLSETAFVAPRPDGFALRWFTPVVEVELCGHATLAAAHVLWEEGRLEQDAPAHFHTLSGLLTARRIEGGVTMDFPAKPEEETDPPSGLAEALGLEPAYCGRSQFDLLADVGSEAALRALRPNFAVLRRVEARGVIATAPAQGGGYDFVSRFFAPRVGIDEDPVTGSAHCVLAPYWARRLGRDELSAHQASRRGGDVRVRLDGDRVHLAGSAVTVLRGTLLA